MILKSFFALALTVSAFVSFAQDMDSRTEMSEDCLSAPTTLTEESGEDYVFDLGLSCEITNYVLTIQNSEGDVVFESKDKTANWNAELVDAGLYNWTLIGTTGTTVEFEHVKKLGTVSIVK
jgi:hypothetical protein